MTDTKKLYTVKELLEIRSHCDDIEYLNKNDSISTILIRLLDDETIDKVNKNLNFDLEEDLNGVYEIETSLTAEQKKRYATWIEVIDYCLYDWNSQPREDGVRLDAELLFALRYKKNVIEKVSQSCIWTPSHIRCIALILTLQTPVGENQ